LLAAESCRAGALGFVAAGHLHDLTALNAEIAVFREKAPPDAPLCIGFIGHSSLKDADGWDRFQRVLKEHKPDVVQFFAPAITVNAAGKSNVDMAHEYAAKVIAQVGSVKDGVEALEAGVDCLIAQGSEAGGHGLRRELGSGTLPLASQLVLVAADSYPNVPVLAAGGIMDGRGVAAALALGCDGAVLGTRLWASQEAKGKDSYKALLVAASSCDDVIRTTVFDHIQNEYFSTPWPEPYDSLGALRNATSDAWDGRPSELHKEFKDANSSLVSDYRKADMEGNTDIAPVLGGQGVGEIVSIDTAFGIITRINIEAMDTIRSMQGLLQG
jgi:nitronate monooxygenase